MVSQKTRLVECGVFLIGYTSSVTITVYLIFVSKWIDTSALLSLVANCIRGKKVTFWCDYYI